MLSFIIAQVTNATNATTAIPPPIQTPVTDTATQAIQNISLWSHVMQADPLVKLTLLILVSFSISCWAIIFYKTRQIKTAQKNSLAFWQRFSTVATISEAAHIREVKQGPLYEIFTTGQATLARVKKAGTKLSDFHRTMLEQRMNQSREEEVYKLEQYVGFLATTASTAPFIGLFGTVWGILTAFMAIGKAGSSSLATVGPYIAEALVATAIGLFAAIPAVVGYNFFVHRIKIINKMVDLFVEDFLLKTELE